MITIRPSKCQPTTRIGVSRLLVKMWAFDQSIVNRIGFASSSNTAGTRVIGITVNDGDDDSTIGTVKINYIV
jgi:hypothetical protein